MSRHFVHLCSGLRQQAPDYVIRVRKVAKLSARQRRKTVAQRIAFIAFKLQPLLKHTRCTKESHMSDFD